MNEIFRGSRFAILLSDTKGAEGAPKRIQILRTGVYYHEELGELPITPEMLKQMVLNFQANVRGVDLAMDYSHESGDIAAGWFKAVSLENNGTELWAEIDWTPLASKRIADKEFRYVSADFSFDYQDNETLQKFGPTLQGAALTNRPFVKNMAPAVELNEGKGEKKMGKTAKLAGDGGVADVGDNQPDPSAVDADGKPLTPEAKLAKLEAEMASLKTQYAACMAENAKLKEAGAATAKDLAAAQKKSKFDVMLSEGKVVPAQREAFMSDNFEEFASKAKAVKLSEIGSGDPVDNDPTDVKNKAEATIEIKKRAAVLLTEKKVKTIGDGISAVLRSDKKLADLYHGKSA